MANVQTSIAQVVGVLQSLSFTTPAVLLALVACALVLFAARQRLRMAPPRLRVAITMVRCLVMGLLVLGLAGPTLRPTGHARAVVFALDVSDSMSPEQQSWARDWIAGAVRALPPGSQAQVVEFGQRAQVETDASSPPGASTDILAGLRLAAALLPRDGRRAPEIVLISDGWQTTDQTLTEALPSGAAVSYVEPPHLGSAANVVIHSLEVPPLARTGDQVELGVTLQAAVPVDVQLRVSFGPTVAADGPLHLEPGETRISVPQQVGTPGFVDVRAELGPAEGSPTSRLSSVMVVKPAGRLLVLEDEPGQGRPLADLLQRQGLEVEVRAPGSLPPSAAGLSNFDAVVMVNTPATALTLDQQRTLQSYVQDLGRGLTVVGGARTFAPGGYQGTVLDDMLPVSAEPPIEPQQGSLALFLVIDRSGSMDILSGGPGQGSGATKLAMAREAAIQAADLLQPDDTLGVIAFDSAFQWVVEPTRLHDQADVRQAQALIGSIRPGGGTSILAPLTAAFEAAAASDAPLKHVVLLTDGESNDRGYEDLIQRMKPSQITLSTLAIGSDADTKLLSSLARLGGGRYYFTERTAQIPRIASKETTILTRNAVVDGRVGAVVGDPSPILRSLPGDFPALSGYVATTRKDRAVTALETERGHPLLAHWQYGLGRVVAWTSEGQQGSVDASHVGLDGVRQAEGRQFLPRALLEQDAVRAGHVRQRVEAVRPRAALGQGHLARLPIRTDHRRARVL